MTPLREVASVKIYVAVVVALVVYALAIIFSGMVPNYGFEVLKYIGFPISAGLAAATMVGHMRRFRWYRYLTGVPELSGRWEGWYYSELSRLWTPIAVEMSQDDIRVTARELTLRPSGPGYSDSLAFAILRGEDKSVQVIWNYRAEEPSPSFGGNHPGTYWLRMTGSRREPRLEGRYMNDRPRRDGSPPGATGQIMYKRTTKRKRLALNYDASKWAIKVSDLPEGATIAPEFSAQPAGEVVPANR